MPAPKNIPLRVIVPLFVLVAGAAFVAVTLMSKGSGSGATTASTAPAQTTAATPSGAKEADEPVAQVADQPSTVADTQPQPEASEPTASGATQPAASAASPAASAVKDWRAVSYDAPTVPLDTIGSLDHATGFRSLIAFTPFGAGVESITMTDFYRSIRRQEHFPLQHVRAGQAAGGASVTLASLAARGVNINGQFIDLFSKPGTERPVWRQTAPGQFVCEIADADGAVVMRLKREFTIAPGSFEMAVAQSASNLTDQPLTMTWVQYGPIDLPRELSGYRLDLRRVRFGYLMDPNRDPSRQFVQADSALRRRTDVVKKASEKGDNQVWPRAGSYKFADQLVWLAQTSRYFAFSVQPLVDRKEAADHLDDPLAHPMDKAFKLAHEVYAVAWPDQTKPGEYDLLLQMNSAPMTLAPGETADLSFGAYAGPLGRRQLNEKQDPVFGALGLSKMVIYNIGGPCAFCTFQPLARGLLTFLTVLHDYVVFDWALAIMLLVVSVRTVLHPITRRSQIGMLRFGKQMQELAPKQKKLKERYKDDSKQLNKEMMRLMRDEGVSYTGVLGCLPMFLQTPVWIALYAMLYFSFDLRHEGAFFGVFQRMSGGSWPFLADLSSADNFIPLGTQPVATIPLLGSIVGINVLPLLLGVVFYLQQKYLTPPPSASLTSEQASQQKMMKVMMVLLFPVMIYNAPSGLTLYFITNSALGILESRYIRAHAARLDLEKPKGGGTGRKKVKSTVSGPANPFKKSRSASPERFKKRG